MVYLSLSAEVAAAAAAAGVWNALFTPLADLKRLSKGALLNVIALDLGAI